MPDAPPPMRSVYSSFVTHIGYDPLTQFFYVAYKNGQRVAYGGVPADVADSIMKAPSIGEALHMHVRGKFQFRYLKDAHDDE